MGLFKDALGLDPFDLNYAYSHEPLKLLELRSKEFLPRRGIPYRIGVFMHHLLREMRERRRDGRPACQPGSPVFFACSRNEMFSLSPIAQRLDGAFTLKIRAYSGEHMEEGETLNLAGAHLAALPFLPVVAMHFLRSRGYRRASFHYTFDYYWLSYGFYIAARRWLRRNRPACVIMANDHVSWCRALLRAAAAEGVPTCYVQHACVTEHFPPLAFDLALLEGRASLRAYARAGASAGASGSASATRVFLAGMPKFDPWMNHLNRGAATTRVLICTNIDPVDRVQELCRELRDRLPGLAITLRPHPGDPRMDMWGAFAEASGLRLSHYADETAFEAIGQADALIAAESSILLEAALVNVFPLYYDFTRRGWDWYGFVRTGLVEKHETPEAVAGTLRGIAEARPDVRALAREYCATVNTRWDGRSAELAAGVLRRFAAGEALEGPHWMPVSADGMKAHEPEA